MKCEHRKHTHAFGDILCDQEATTKVTLHFHSHETVLMFCLKHAQEYENIYNVVHKVVTLKELPEGVKAQK